MQQSALSPFGFRGEGGLESSAAITTGDEATVAPGAPTCSPTSHSEDQDDPSKCIMWCAIGLGALVQGVPVEKVSTHCAATELGTRTAARNRAVQDQISDGFLSRSITLVLAMLMLYVCRDKTRRRCFRLWGVITAFSPAAFSLLGRGIVPLQLPVVIVCCWRRAPHLACFLCWCGLRLLPPPSNHPPNKVKRYVELARASLAECFDGGTAETARCGLLYVHRYDGFRLFSKHEPYVFHLVRLRMPLSLD